MTTDQLPSWRDSAAKRAIIDFVAQVRTDRVAADERVAVFDHDGTLWPEQPMPMQLAFAIDRVKHFARGNPAWCTREPFKSVLADDLSAVTAAGERGIAELIVATHMDMTSDEFSAIVTGWLTTARHPALRRPYTRCVYQPMLELLAYLRAAEFTTFIVSGSGVELLRPWSQFVYGVPPERVIGSRCKLRYEYREGGPVFFRLPEIEFADDDAGKPAAIHEAIGRRPILAFGNSDGDFEMLEWTTSGPGPRLAMVLHHTDAAREFAYDRESDTGTLSRALDEAPARGWHVVEMHRDWGEVFAPA